MAESHPTPEPDAVQSRRCPRCGQTKLVCEFDISRANRYGLATYCKVCRHNRQAGVKRANKLRWNEQEIALLVDRYATTPNHELAILLPRNTGSIMMKARELGLSKTVTFSPPRLCSGNRRFQIRDDVFDTLTPNTAYALGLLTADGSLRRPKKAWHTPNEFSLVSKDLELATKFRDALGADYEIKPFREKYYRIGFTNAPAYQALLRWGLTPNKSCTVQMPAVGDALFFHFLRGYFDGDGSVFGWINIGFTSGSVRLLEQIDAEIGKRLKFRGNILHYKPPRKAHDLRYCGPRALAIADAMYADCGDIFLSRKRARFEDYRANRQRVGALPAEANTGQVKWCSRCRRYLPFGEFGRSKNRPGGLGYCCRRCKREYCAQLRARHKNTPTSSGDEMDL